MHSSLAQTHSPSQQLYNQRNGLVLRRRRMTMSPLYPCVKPCSVDRSAIIKSKEHRGTRDFRSSVYSRRCAEEIQLLRRRVVPFKSLKKRWTKNFITFLSELMNGLKGSRFLGNFFVMIFFKMAAFLIISKNFMENF